MCDHTSSREPLIESVKEKRAHIKKMIRPKMVIAERTVDVGSHARVTYEEVEASGPPVSPLEFPEHRGIVQRGARITVKGCCHRTGKLVLVKNVLIRIVRDSSSGIPYVHDRGYCISRKLCDSVYGSVRLCVVMKRRLSFHQEEMEARTPWGSLESIDEEDDWEKDIREVLFEEKNKVWESTDEVVVAKVRQIPFS